MPSTPEERTTAARRAALIRWSRENPGKQAAAGQAGLLAKFEREVDPDNQLREDERRRRAEAARRAHMIGLAQASRDARLLARFERQVDPDNQLPEDERRRLAKRALDKHRRDQAERERAAAR